ncbi:MAG: M20 family metallopeptidase [Planctomycetes bacterium]|nr:M20 family metallopeptidase [Planctomycetota bacterium]
MSLHPVIAKTIAQSSSALKKLALDIHAAPEPGYAEHKAVAWQTRLLKQWGFQVRRPFASLETAYRASAGKGKPVVCFMAEYDALPELGHGCGHNLICAAALGAGRALAAALKADRRAGTVVVMGTPAEEGGGGKVEMIDQGALKDVDMALMAHPSVRTQPWTGSTAIQRFEVSYAGQSAHAAAGPHRGRNALDAVRLLFAGVDAWRQQLPESSRVHGIVTNGGAAPNIIPDKAVCDFFLRSPQDDVLDAMVRRFQAIAKGAAMMTDTAVAIRTKDRPYKAPWLNAPLNDAWVETTAEMKLKPRIDAEMGRVSTDFSDVSQVVPGSHVYFGITRKENLPSHSPQFAEASASPFGVAQMLKAAEALANVGYRYATDDTFRKAVHDAYDEKRRAAKGRKA